MSNKIRITPCLEDEKEGWIKNVSSIDEDKTGGYAFNGTFLTSGKIIEVNVTDVILVVNKRGSRKNWWNEAEVFVVGEEGLIDQTDSVLNFSKEFLVVKDLVRDALRRKAIWEEWLKESTTPIIPKKEEKIMNQEQPKQRLSQSIVMLEDIQMTSKKNNYNPLDLDKAARLILADGGCVTPLILREVEHCRYLLVEGDFTYWAAQKAAEFDPLAGETINAYVFQKSDSYEQQVEIFRGGVFDGDKEVKMLGQMEAIVEQNKALRLKNEALLIENEELKTEVEAEIKVINERFNFEHDELTSPAEILNDGINVLLENLNDARDLNEACEIEIKELKEKPAENRFQSVDRNQNEALAVENDELKTENKALKTENKALKTGIEDLNDAQEKAGTHRRGKFYPDVPEEALMPIQNVGELRDFNKTDFRINGKSIFEFCLTLKASGLKAKEIVLKLNEHGIKRVVDRHYEALSVITVGHFMKDGG